MNFFSLLKVLTSRVVGATTFAPLDNAVPVAGVLLQNDGAGLTVIPVFDGGPDGFGFTPLILRDNADNVAEIGGGSSPGAMLTMSRLTGYDGVNWDRIRAVPDNVDAQAAATIGALVSLSRQQRWNGATYDRLRTNSASVLSGATQPFAGLSAPPGEWSVTNEGAVATRATVTRAAGGAGVRHVCRSLEFSVAAVNAQGILNARVRDGATGVGTILWSANFVLAAGTSDRVAVAGLNIVGSANTAMTFEFDVGPAGGNFQVAGGSGYSTI